MTKIFKNGLKNHIQLVILMLIHYQTTMVGLMLIQIMILTRYANIESMKKANVNRDIMPLITVSILGKSYLAILDSGATFTCVGDSVYDDAK